MTKKLFDNGLLFEFEATVLSCTPNGERYEIVLDQTAFAPEGGGQLSDIGYIGDAFVDNVQFDDGVIVHYANKSLAEGRKYTCKIDEKRRMRHVQNHSGEHIVSGIIFNKYGYNNVGFHLGSEDVTMDVDGEIDREMLREIELLANEAVVKNLEVKAVYPEGEELQKMFFRSKLDLKSDVRVVTVEGLDACACCAPHVNRTGEIGIIKLISCMRYKGGTRIHLKCGFDALEEFNMEYDRALAISNMISVPRENIVDGVKKLTEDVFLLKREIFELKKKITDMKIASVIPQNGKAVLIADDLEMSELRRVVAAKLDECPRLCAAFSGNDEEGYTFVIGYKGEDFGEFVKSVFARLGGGGGGKPPFAQGKAKCKKSDIEELLID